MSARLVAAVDLGTTSTRLLVARRGSDGVLEVVERRAVVTELGRDARAGMLADDAIDRTVHCLASYRVLLDELGVDAVVPVATAAVRGARNADEVVAAAEALLGVEPTVLTGEAEAEYSWRGARRGLDDDGGPFLVVDIGGGSTEFAHGTVDCDARLSVPLGAVGLTAAHLLHDPPRPEELTAALSVVELHLDDVVAAIPEAPRARTLVGTAATVLTAAAVEIGVDDPPPGVLHHFRLSKAAVEDVFRTLATETCDERVENPGMDESRAHLIVGGLCILVRIMRQFDFDECVVSESDLLDALIEENW